MAKPRGIRFTAEETKQIEEFLTINPIFDFSSLGRMAILEFIRDPKIRIQPISTPMPTKKSASQQEATI